MSYKDIIIKYYWSKILISLHISLKISRKRNRFKSDNEFQVSFYLCPSGKRSLSRT